MTPDELERLVLVASLAVKVECRPFREDGTTPVVHSSSGATLERRIRATPDKVSVVPPSIQPAGTAPAAYHWNIVIRAGSVRRTLYTAWVDKSAAQVEEILKSRQRAAQLRASLPHDQRKKKPWGPL